MATPEGKVKSYILNTLGGYLNGLYYNNPTGLGIPYGFVKKMCPHCRLRIDHGQPIEYGLRGSADIMGVTAMTITADMVGQTIGVATAVEVKTDTGRQSDQQKRFQQAWERLGGIYILARNPADLAHLTHLNNGGDK